MKTYSFVLFDPESNEKLPYTTKPNRAFPPKRSQSGITQDLSLFAKNTRKTIFSRIRICLPVGEHAAKVTQD